MAFTLSSDISRLIYPCDDHTYPGYYRFAFDGTEKKAEL